MPIRFSFSSLKHGCWYEYLVRFILGGLATVATGLISLAWGPSIGGLFLALPAIFCASATLVEQHEIRRKKEHGLQGTRRGEKAAALDAAGAALGSLGMLAFAGCFTFLIVQGSALAFAVSSIVWMITAAGAWWLRRTVRIAHRAG